MKRAVLVLVCLAALGCLAASVQNAYAWGKKEVETEKIAVNFYREVERGGYQVVTTEELKQWIDQGRDMLIVDTMPYEASYKKQHIPGAVQMEFPIPELERLEPAQKDAFLKLLGSDKDRLIVFYCGFTKCTRSHNGAMWAVRLGYTNVVRCPGGIKAWKEAGYPVEKVK
ncbi:Rhodanese-related sulfurtransferase [Desulfacinum hydrothermale DSM 13146]|uniref:Rhodanese-related sulfurtransferase n=1 Tax=Desulfacinum hydrothermale DSM 13146 TaxID=1121390 RepID=A0A1W1XIA8_9BACT|nr:rhodanese-like domain-containing protein [Desulfacinum hydrothermale]SMC23726.1 Rhodanese-related sulfurtransferase [Desulfacinum hydrothermale DSM 13146]